MAANRDDPADTGVSRRDLLKQIGLAGAVVAIPLRATEPDAFEQIRTTTTAAVSGERFETLTADEGELLEAVVARIIPTDANGPGAAEARAARYIDRALSGALAGSRKAYADGLAALDRYSRSTRGASFARLPAADQDAVLRDLETGSAAGFSEPTASAFFAMVRAHTIQGTFGDPFYGGNANFVGWDLLGYPGVRLVVTADEQRLGTTLTPIRRSAYEHAMFVKATARRSEIELPLIPADRHFHGD
ncbi:MAG: gluconate 2-dehydrogenase subunit 3 family protein [Acidobacteria bacterium]|nr:gluconate 2-dehydrogenase subunit 3 family protein [Acidobacteriota bacterium]